MAEALNSQHNPALTGDVLSVVALLRDESGRVLLASSSDIGPWSCIGGGIAEGEEPKNAAIRFAREDCGLTIDVGEVLAELSGDQYRVIYECGVDTTYRTTVFDARLISEEESAPLRTNWFTLAELDGLHLDEFPTAALTDLRLL